MASVFISYASPDNVFALRLATSVTTLGHSVWIDQWAIGVGDAAPRKIERGLDRTDYVVAVLSRHTLTSSWMERELQITYYEEITQRKTIILPVIIEDCVVPPFLRPKRFADFRLGYDIGLAQLAITLHMPNDYAGIFSYYAYATQSAQLPLPVSLCDNFGYTGSVIPSSPRLTEINVEIGLPYIGKITGMWKPDENEQRAAWELYIELVTRVSVAGLQPEEGLLRESLSSLYIIFNTTRDILRKYGPGIARPKTGSDLSFGYLAIHILNFALRPVLSVWHPLLLDYEHTREPATSAFEHEKRWEKEKELRRVLNDTRHILHTYTNILAQVADVPQLIGT